MSASAVPANARAPMVARPSGSSTRSSRAQPSNAPSPTTCTDAGSATATIPRPANARGATAVTR